MGLVYEIICVANVTYTDDIVYSPYPENILPMPNVNAHAQTTYPGITYLFKRAARVELVHTVVVQTDYWSL